jgi:hypothetical protein
MSSSIQFNLSDPVASTLVASLENGTGDGLISHEPRESHIRRKITWPISTTPSKKYDAVVELLQEKSLAHIDACMAVYVRRHLRRNP